MKDHFLIIFPKHRYLELILRHTDIVENCLSWRRNVDGRQKKKTFITKSILPTESNDLHTQRKSPYRNGCSPQLRGNVPTEHRSSITQRELTFLDWRLYRKKFVQMGTDLLARCLLDIVLGCRHHHEDCAALFS